MAGRTSVASSAATRRPPPTPPPPPHHHHHHRHHHRRRRRLKDGRALGDTALSAGLATTCTSRRVCSAHILLRLLIVSGYMHT